MVRIFQLKNSAIKLVNDFFAKGHQRTLEVKKNIASSFLIKGLSIAINLALVPLTINYVNPSQYGIWLTLSSIIGWISFFDIGFGNGLRNRFAEAKASGNYEKARIYVSTTYTTLAILFTIVWLIFLITNFFLNWSTILNAPEEMAVELSKLAFIVVSFFCLQMVLKTINTIIIADQKPAKAMFFDMLGQLIALCIIYILTKTTHGSLINLGLALSGAPVFIIIIASLWFYTTDYKYFIPSLKYFKLSSVYDIIKLGSKFFLIQIGVIVIYQTNNIIIAHISNMEAVASFNIANKYFGIIVMAFSIIMAPFWSAFTEAYVKNDFYWMQTTLKKLTYISFLGILGICVLILISKYIYVLWIGNSVYIPISTTIIVGVNNMVLLLIWLYTPLLNGIGKIKIQTMTYIFAIICHIPFALFLGKNTGIVGVILSSAIFSTFILIFAHIQVRLLVKNKAKGIWND
ncbi:MAG: polysaccharide biosynthesis protein [Lutibacter sp.]|nr:MAG: polysaccharide biosynthesis protein [Lutibacter sp.]